MIYLGSRYQSTEVQYILDQRSGSTRPTVLRANVRTATPSQVYRWRERDRVDTIGKRFSGKSVDWWQVMDRNSENIDPLSIAIGASVVVK